MDPLWSGKSLGFAGGGNMAEALVKGIIGANLLPSQHIAVYDPLPTRRVLFANLGCQPVESIHSVMQADVVLLAMKPQNLREAVAEVSREYRPATLLISIAAGIGTRVIEQTLPEGARVIRVMPNTPLLVGKGMSGLAKGSAASAADMQMALSLFSCSGTAVEVEERLLDSVTALSGSGPAYLFLFAEALIAAGVKLGLTPALAKQLTITMLNGSAEMLSQYQDPALLRQQVTSPGGTTAAALAVFEKRDFAGMVAEALAAANARSIELGRDA